MHKQDFLLRLRKGLSGLPQNHIDEHLTFYNEMIDDRMEDGLSEEEAVSAVGSADEIATQILAETPPAIAKPKKPVNIWIIVLLVLGAPIWLSLGTAAVAVVFSLYVSLWAVIVSVWAVFGALAGTSFGIIAAGIVFICTGIRLPGMALIGAGFVCAGLSVLLFFGCKAATKGLVWLTKKLFSVVLKKEGASCKKQ